MSIKPATDEEIERTRKHTPGPWYVRAEQLPPGLLAVVALDGDSLYKIATCHENDAPLIAAAPALIARIEADRDEIARLKAEVERLTPKCPVCLGYRTTTPSGNTPCHFCHGTGRAR